MLAEFYLTPGGVISWLMVGLLAGWLAGLFMQGSGLGILTDIIVGLIGAFVGGLAFSLFMAGEVGFWGSIGVAFVGACIVLAIVRAVAPSRNP
jgi:uncharacterized membrane protein YeaQ/YmgE (transglycosylase-associated protein family)